MGEMFWENFFGEILRENFYGRIFLGGIFERNFFGRNSLFRLLKSTNLFEYGRIDLFVKILVCVKEEEI